MEAVYEGAEVKIITEDVEGCYTFMEVSSPKRKKKSKNHGENAEKAKKPRSAYLLYYFDIHQSMQQEYPDIPQSEINKRISESWKRLNVADKGYYLERAKLEKEGIDPNNQMAGISADVPGFRKILPRANYYILPKSAVADERAVNQVEVCLETEAQEQQEGTPIPHTLSHEALFSPMGLGSEVELSEQCIAIEALSGETATALTQSGALQEILSQYSGASQDGTATGFVVKEEAVEMTEGYGAVSVLIEEATVTSPTVQQTQEETHLVTIIPNQELVDTNVSAGTSPLVMVPLNTRPDPNPKPSFKLSIKYTRRGRGSCQTPGCSFTYVTRHKPPQCPQCGKHLGGKWVPSGKKAQSRATTTAAAVNRGSSREQQKCVGEVSLPPLESSESVTQLIVAASSCDTDAKAQWKEMLATSPAGTVCATQCRTEGSDLESEGTKNTGVEWPAITEKSTPGGTRNKSPALMLPSTKNPAVSSPVINVSNMKTKLREKSTVIGSKRPIRAILPAPTQTGPDHGTTYVQWVALPPDKMKDLETPKNNGKTTKRSSVKVSGLKPSTLKQLGHPVKSVNEEQALPSPINSNSNALTEKGVKIVSVLSYKQSPITSLDLGLSTARGRGKCKNPSCDYVYKNRHKPHMCPSCGWDLTTEKKPKMFNVPVSVPGLLDPYQPLNAAQKEVQRQSTLQLLRKTVLIPESEAELVEAMALIQELNSTQVVLSTANEETIAIEQSGWPRYYESSASQCLLCNCPLFKGGQNSVAGQEDCWLLTDSHIQTATVQLKICLNPQCLALHSFSDIHLGLFNVGNKLLVSIDILFKIRNQIKLGHNPKEAALLILENVQNQPVNTLNPSELSHILELLCSGYWAFECLTVRDYNDMICGVCGIAPKMEIAQRNTDNVLHLKNMEFTWPDFQAPDEVNVDDFWSTMESEAIEQAAFPSSIPITKFDASIIAPFFPPLMRNSVIINTEKDKNFSDQAAVGNIAALVRLIHEGTFKPDQVNEYSKEELRDFLHYCSVPNEPEDTEKQMGMAICALYAYIQNGILTAKQPPAHLTAGKFYKICPHQVICGSKYIVRRETARDHVDLLVSSRYWPPVYVTDAPRQVAVCTDVRYPELAAQMWGKNQGCFSDPMADPEYVSCAELQDQQYSMDISGAESSLVHPITKSPSRWVVHSREDLEESGDPTARNHCLSLCQELEPYTSVISGLKDSKTSAVRQKPFAFDNAAYYYLYNRLIDFLTSKDIVNQQISDILQSCQPGEVVIRDTLYRLGVAQINTEVEVEEETVLPE
ncbi:HMG domain-containing protein 3 isoform X3 [Lepisosteus oculatus]|uniref:HMG domain-containing protein 3 isoform X3 n=1 Tax=Lepisosteus oculatus TaxID=7918 RepID=UPI0035F51F93